MWLNAGRRFVTGAHFLPFLSANVVFYGSKCCSPFVVTCIYECVYTTFSACCKVVNVKCSGRFAVQGYIYKGWGRGSLETKRAVLGGKRGDFRRQKSEKFPFCRSYSPFLSCDGGAELHICRSKITYLSAVVSLFVGGNLLICRRAMAGCFECQIVSGSYIIYYND